MKKGIVFLLCGVLSIGMLTACGNKKQAEKKSTVKEVDTVKLSVWGAPDDHDMLQEMINRFEEKHKSEAKFNISIQDIGEVSCREELLKDVKKAADVFAFPDDQLMTLAASGVLAKVPDAKKIEGQNLPGAVSAAKVNDTLHAYPMTADNGYFMFYNKKYFSEKDVTNLDRILAIAAQNKKKFCMEITSGWYLYSFFGNTGLKVGLENDGVTNFCNWNDKKESIRGIDVANSLEKLVGSKGFTSRTDADFIKGVQKGEIIAGVSGVWDANALQKAWKDDYAACKLPQFTCRGRKIQMASFAGYKLLGVNNYSEYPKWANELAKWLTNEENQAIRFEVRGMGPSNKKVAESDEISKSVAMQALIAQSEFSSLQRIGGNYWSPAGDFVTAIMKKKTSEKEKQQLLDQMVKQITKSVVESKEG